MALFKTEEEKEQERRKKLLKAYDKFKKEYQTTIPSNFNQCELLDELTNDDVDHLLSISNRTDGKTVGYITFFMLFSIHFGIGFTLVSRHHTLKYAYAQLTMELTELNKNMDISLIYHKPAEDYMMIVYDNKTIGIITDLNNATDLKYHSNYIKNFPIIIYDEFLAIESDYLPDEWIKLNRIYSSINRSDNGYIDYIGHPKIIYLGNAENFSSPVLSNLNLFDKLENHEMNTMQVYGNIVLEMRKNENANERRNTRAFNDANDSMSTAEFKVNRHLLADKTFKEYVLSKLKYFYIKLEEEMYIRVDYVEYFNKPNDVILSVVTTNNKISDVYCIKLSDLTKDNIYLDDKYFKQNHYKNYIRGDYLFLNSYSKNMILDNNTYNSININKCISHHISNSKTDTDVILEMKMKDDEIERKMKVFMNRFFNY